MYISPFFRFLDLSLQKGFCRTVNLFGVFDGKNRAGQMHALDGVGMGSGFGMMFGMG